MSLSSLANSLRAAFNRANIGSLPSALKQIAFGDVLRTLPTHLRGKAPAAAATNPYVTQAGVNVLTLPESAKGLVLDAVYARAGTGTKGPLTIDASASSAPAAGHVKLAPTGDIMFASADAWTSVDVSYRPQKQDIVELTLPVVSNAIVLPTTAAKLAVSLIEAEALAGSVVGKCVIQPPGAAPATTTWANLSLDKLSVLFVVADGVTSARVKLGIASAVDVDALLEGASVAI